MSKTPGKRGASRTGRGERSTSGQGPQRKRSAGSQPGWMPSPPPSRGPRPTGDRSSQFVDPHAGREAQLLRASALPIVSVDVVELNPTLDPTGGSLEVAAGLTAALLGEELV